MTWFKGPRFDLLCWRSIWQETWESFPAFCPPELIHYGSSFIYGDLSGPELASKSLNKDSDKQGVDAGVAWESPC